MRVLIDNINGDPFLHLDGCDTTGQNLFVHYLARHLASRGVDVTVSTRAAGGKSADSKQDGVTMWRMPVGPPRYLCRDDVLGLIPAYLDELIARIRRKRKGFDIVHGNYWLSAPVVCAIKEQALACALVYTPHSLGRVKSRSVGIAPPLRDEYECEVIGLGDVIHVLSTDEREALRTLYPPTRGEAALIGHGVDENVFAYQSKGEARKGLEWSPAERVFLFVGRFEEQKDLPLAMRVFSRVAGEDASNVYRMVICGGTSAGNITPDALPDEVRLAMRGKPENAAFVFAGRILNRALGPYYCAADVLLMPSRYEPFGLVALEAQACGLPVAASEVGGLRATIRRDQTGYHVPPRYEAGFVSAANRLLERSWQCEEKRRRISEFTHSRFSWNHAAGQLLDAYTKVLGNKSRESNHACS